LGIRGCITSRATSHVKRAADRWCAYTWSVQKIRPRGAHQPAPGGRLALAFLTRPRSPCSARGNCGRNEEHRTSNASGVQAAPVYHRGINAQCKRRSAAHKHRAAGGFMRLRDAGHILVSKTPPIPGSLSDWGKYCQIWAPPPPPLTAQNAVLAQLHSL